MSLLHDQDRQLLSQGKICLLGYGAQGEAEATNLRRSEINFTLGIRLGGRSEEKARQSGLSFVSIEEAVRGAESIVMNLSDQSQKDIYDRVIASEKSVRRLVFAHGFNTHFGRIPVLPSGPRHVLVAPKGAASGLKEFYGTAHALPAILGVRPTEALAREKAWAEAYARAIGCNSRALVWADFKDETDCDLFSEQALLCGGVSQLLKQAFEVMVEAGYSEETAYFESLYELKLIVDLIWKEGLTGMRSRISPTARYGDITRGPRIIDASVKNRMKEILKEIQSGKFAEEFLKEADSPEYLEKLAREKEHLLEIQGRKLRQQMTAPD